jgi:crotonobetainyl-CoA:carnitine CoA-transferase CaiB-like acyl-CoA transferase
MVLSIGNDPTFAKFCRNFGIEPLLEDPRFATNAARVGNRQLVTDTLAQTMRTQTTAWWIEKLEALQIGCGPINTLEQVFADPQVQARGNLIEMTHVSGAPMRLIANPVRLSETPADYRTAPPALGQHTAEVLAGWLGLDEAALAALRDKEII